MKTLIYTNWSLLALYGVGLLIAALTLNQPGNDAAGRAMGTGFIVIGFILLLLLVGANCLPFKFARIGVLLALLVPIGLSLSHFISQYTAGKQASSDDDARFTGTYYFHDEQRQQLAQAIADKNLARFEELLQQPIPLMNESGAENNTLLDFAAMRGVYSDNPDWILPYLNALVNKGATVKTADPLHTPTHALVGRNCPARLLEWFLTHGGEANALNLQGLQPTHILFIVMDYEPERTEKIKLLLDHGADPNVIYPTEASDWLAGHSALLAAARQDLWDVCILLLEKGADPSVKGPQQQVFRELIARRAATYAESGQTPAAFTKLQEVMASRKL